MTLCFADVGICEAYFRPMEVVKNTRGWPDNLGSGILFGKYILGFFKKINLDDI